MNRQLHGKRAPKQERKDSGTQSAKHLVPGVADRSRSLRKPRLGAEHYVSFFASARTPLLITHRNGKVLDANAAAARIAGTGDPIFECFARDSVSEAQRALSEISVDAPTRTLRLLLRQNENGPSQVANVTLIQSRYPTEVHWIFHPHVSESDNADRIATLEHAYQEQRALNTALVLMHRDALGALSAEHAAKLRAEQAERAKDHLLATISHELRTPLNAMLGWAQLLRHKLVNPEHWDRAIRSIEQSAAMQAKLVTDLLEASRMHEGTFRLEVAEVQLDAVVSNVREALMPMATAKSVNVSLAASPTKVQADEARLQQVFLNLLANAIKFTPPFGKVDIQISNTEPCRVEICDTGRGIRPEFLPRVFEPFAQDRDVPNNQGLGIGLTIAKRIVELHGGRIWAVSAGDQLGSTFVVELPTTVSENASVVWTGDPLASRRADCS